MGAVQDLTGQRFGRLTVVERAPNKIQPCGRKRAMWKCKCDCGNVIITLASRLKNGNTKSCGCLRKEIASQTHLKNITGMRFGKLTVVRRLQSNARQQATWLCKCDCGSEIIVSGHDLRTGATRSCGCTASFGEEMTRKILLEKSIEFSTQYKFNGLKSKHGYMLKFDFALQNKNKETLCLIEYQGKQHYIDCGWFGKQQREETDQIKRDYCKEHNIPLYEIRYDEDVEKRIDEILADIHYFDDKPQPAASARLV